MYRQYAQPTSCIFVKRSCCTLYDARITYNQCMVCLHRQSWYLYCTVESVQPAIVDVNMHVGLVHTIVTGLPGVLEVKMAVASSLERLVLSTLRRWNLIDHDLFELCF